MGVIFTLLLVPVHDDTNGFEPMDISRAQATLGDSTINYMADLSSTFTSPGHTSSLSPSSPELFTNDQRRELDEFHPSEHKSELHETEHDENTKYNEVKTEHHELNTDLNAFNPVEHNEFHAEHNELNIGHNELNNEHNELNTEYNAFATEHNELNTEHEFNTHNEFNATHNEFHAKDNELNAEQNEFASATERYETMNPFENPFDKDSTHQVTGSAFEHSTDAFSNDFTNVPEENVTKNPESLHAGSVSDVVPDVASKAEETLGEDGVSHGKADLDAFESHKTTDETAKTTNETREITAETTLDTANSGETLDAAIAESEFTADQTKLGEFDDLETKLSHDENKGKLTFCVSASLVVKVPGKQEGGFNSIQNNSTLKNSRKSDIHNSFLTRKEDRDRYSWPNQQHKFGLFCK
ncbi:variant-silencing SET domain-containing protein isoform X2 [Diaphorina citri]|uniref:Variant-silencing SET domain-containing protein isoform X2 n=2 Tax=Diaphorina citri TaxID=121845 RepID=A0A3Q0JNM5_DIACI|nr:variant-silencing SET domain-containing protein isoform X2 [Diaphorina citri]